jgi:F-type H+-transporting ATPase subunit b
VLIDWFTVVAQIVNFLVLLLLLRRFLYRPILDAMQARAKRIAGQLEAAENKRIEAEVEKEEFRAKNEELRQYYEQKQAEAVQEVDSWRKQTLHDARRDVDQNLSTWRKSIEQEKQAFAAELRRFSVRQAYAVSRQSLQDLADARLEDLMLEKFLSRLETGEISLKAFDGSADDGLTLRSAFEIPASRQKKIRDVLRAQLGPELTLHFEVDSDLLGGLELATPDGYQAAWNLKRYLDALEEELDSHLAQNQAQA